MADPPPFAIRAWPTTSTEPYQDTPAATLEVAIEQALTMGWDIRFRQVVVTDPYSTLWAQFSMLWQHRKAPADG